MLWYGGNVAEAVQQSKQKNAVFVVFVEGDNDASKKLLEVIEHDVIATKLSDVQKFLAIKLKSSSPDYTHFARIYQFVPAPCMFFIGRGGVPLDVICDGVDVAKLGDRIDRILTLHEGTLVSGQPSTTNINLRTATEDLLRTEAQHEARPSTSHDGQSPPKTAGSHVTSATTSKEVKTSDVTVPSRGQNKDFDIVCVGEVCVRVPKTEGDPENKPAEPDATTQTKESEARLEKVKEMLEKKRIEKDLKAKEEEKAKELERRNVGQGVAELKRWQKDQEMKQLQEEQKKEKEATALARQRVLAQIEQDKAERKARMARAQDGPPQPAVPTPAPVVQPTAPTASATTARLQLKLPNGSSHIHTFDAESTLAELRLYIRDHVPVSGALSLWLAFPRRELTVDRDAETLRQLGLVPSAAMLVLSVGGGPLTVSGPAAVAPVVTRLIAILTALFSTMLLEPAQGVYRWIRNTLFGGQQYGRRRSLPRGGGSALGGTSNRTVTSTGARAGSLSGSPGGEGGASPRPGGEGQGPRIRRIRDMNQDDDMNTYNGNSTQQL